MSTRAGLAVLVLACAACTSPARAAPGPALSVDAAQDRHAISPDIYGINFADQALAGEINLPVDRWGGNLFEKYNWQLGSTNFGRDNYFENAADCFIFGSTCAAGNTPFYRTFVERARARATKPLLALPLLGYVAKNAPTDHPFTCSYFDGAPPYDTYEAYDPFDSPCGNGRVGGQFQAVDPTGAGVAITSTNSGSWVTDLVSRYGDAAHGGVQLYELGNEPALWNSTHPDMHFAKTTYSELRDKTVAHATAVKAADPTAKVLAFSEWGWPNYFCSAADNVDNGCFASSPDRATHGGKQLVSWLLGELKAASEGAGGRLVDYLDIHYYTQGHPNARPTDVTRSLWDPAFTDPSWIADTIRLIPRMKEWVAADYPGTKISLSEYDLSLPSEVADADRLNVLIEADALGIFGREGLDLAAFFDERPGQHLDQGGAVAPAFRLFRSYDGEGGRFGDTSVRAVSADQARVAVYAAERASDGRLTVAVVNKDDTALTSTLSLAGFEAQGGSVQTWSWAGGAITRGADTTLDGRAHDFAQRSLTLFVAAPVDGSQPESSPTPSPSPTASPSPSPSPKPAPSSTPTPAPTATAPRRCATVPTGLVGKTLSAARKRLKARGCLSPRVVYSKTRRGKRGRVIKAVPKSGRALKAGVRITLTVAKRR